MPTAPFQLYLWPQRLLVLAPAFASERHRHHAAQIALGVDGPAVYLTPETGWHRADVLVIAPDTPHAHPAFGSSALLYLEPESQEWTRFPGRPGSGILELPFDDRLRGAAHRAGMGDAAAAQFLAEALIGKHGDNAPHTDALVEDACRLIRQGLRGPITLAALAAAVHRSPSRLAHRFREATGVPLRRYVLWCRLRAAAEGAMRGASLTEAAHGAGFADSAHLSRTFRAMFGIRPSLLFERPGSVRVQFFT